MLHRALVSALLAGVWLFSAGTAFCGELVWCRFDGPPMNIPSGPLKDEGYSDQFVHDLFGVMEGFEHREVVCTVARTLKLIAETPDVCNGSLVYSPERDRFVHYSKRAVAYVPNRLLVLKKNKKRLAPYMVDGSVDLRKLLMARKLTIGFVRGRAYGDYVDKPLADAGRSGNIRWLTTLTAGVRSFLAGRLDLLVAYPNEVVYFSRLEDVGVGFTSVPIQGEKMVDIYVGCSDSPTGRKAIAQINELLENGYRGVYLKYYLEWLDESSQEAVLRHVSGWKGVGF